MELNQKGLIKLVGRTDLGLDNDENRGMVVFEAADTAAATDIMNNDPCVKKGVMSAVLHPFRLAIYGGEIVTH